MILVLMQKPVMILGDMCPGHVVIRSLKTSEVDGIVTWRPDLTTPHGSRTTGPITTLVPGGILTRWDTVCHETQIPLNQISTEYTRRPFGKHLYRETENTMALIPEPFDVATGAQDPNTKVMNTWRAGVYIQKKKGVWLITVRDISNPAHHIDQCSIATRELDDSLAAAADLPIVRLLRTRGPKGRPDNAWGHLLADD